MGEIEKIQRYIERTVIPLTLGVRYGCRMNELEAIALESRHPLEAVLLAFKYGKAKGYRAGKKAAELELEKAHSEKRQHTAAVRPAVQATADRRA